MMKAIRRAFLALVALGLIIAVAGAARTQGWHAVLRAFVDALPILGVIGALIGALAVMDRREARMHRRFYRHGSKAAGTIVSVTQRTKRTSGIVYEVAVAFNVDGKTYRAASGRLPDRPRRRVGDPVPVYYNPQKPEDNCILDADLM